MLKTAVSIAFVAWIATMGAAQAEPTATMPHPDPKMPPMPSMEGPDPTGDLAKPPLTKPSTTISSSKAGSAVAVKPKRAAGSKHAAAPGGSKTSRTKPGLAKAASVKAAGAKPASGKTSRRKAEVRRQGKATGRVAVSTHGKVTVRPAVKHKKR